MLAERIPDRIKELINKGEGIDIELKTAKFKLSKDTFDSICAFLNRNGGDLILGVADNGEIKGILDDSVQGIIDNLTTNANNPQKLNPTFYLSPKAYEDEKQNKIIHVFIPESSQVHSTNGRIFDRNEDGDFDVTGNNDHIGQLYLRKKATYTENKIYSHVTIDCFKDDLFQRDGTGNIDPSYFSPYPKNSVIARFFKEIGRADELGSGVRNTFRYCKLFVKDANPKFIEGDVFTSIIPIPSAIRTIEIKETVEGTVEGAVEGVNEGVSDALNDAISEGVNEGVSEGVNEGVSEGVNEGVKMALKKVTSLIIKNKAKKANEIAIQIGVSQSTAERYIGILRKSKIIAYKGSPKTGGYYITDEFKKRLKNQ